MRARPHRAPRPRLPRSVSGRLQACLGGGRATHSWFGEGVVSILSTRPLAWRARDAARSGATKPMRDRDRGWRLAVQLRGWLRSRLTRVSPRPRCKTRDTASAPASLCLFVAAARHAQRARRRSTSHGRPTSFTAMEAHKSLRDRDRRQWRFPRGMRVGCLALGWGKGRPGLRRTAQRRSRAALGRKDGTERAQAGVGDLLKRR